MKTWHRSPWIVLVLCACAAPRAEEDSAASSYDAVVSELVRCIEHEREAKGLPAVSIALVDGDQVVWAQGFGLADPEAGVAADPDTVYRVGSVSKLFTDMALMQLVERGELSLDDPVTRLLPDFAHERITFRQLTGHRAGLVREPPVGNYFADDEPTLEATVASLNRTKLVHDPGTRTKYSNAGIAVLGRALEVHYGQPYAELMSQRVLAPLGMQRAAFAPTPEIERRLARARMWAYDGREYDAPTFELGMAPAGSLYASVLDLAQFLRVLFAGGGDVLATETLETMMTPGTDANGRPTSYGIGFAVSQLEGQRRCGHGGAIYGFSTELGFLPEQRLGVAVTSSIDVSNAVTRRLADHALQLLLARRAGRPLPRLALTQPLDPAQGRAIAGLYRRDGERAEVVWRADEGAWLEWRGRRAALRTEGDHLRVDDRHVFGVRVDATPEGLRIGGALYSRDPDPKPAPCPSELVEYVGEYGWDHNVLFVREVDGALEALIEWFWYDPLRPGGPDLFALPDDRGLYPGEVMRFERDGAGRITHAVLGGVAFERRHPGAPAGEPFTVEALYPEAELRARARAASPPVEAGDFHEPDLVDLAEELPEVLLDVRYATTNNFLRTVFYPEPRAFLQRPASAALERVRLDLNLEGLGLVVFDAYRPWHVTKMFWDATPPEHKHFVADPSRGSRHNRGCAVDLSLVELATGEVVETTGGYDEFSERSYPDYPGGTALQRWYRERLRRAMETHGFSVYRWEWWHYDFVGWERYPILDLEFAQLDAVRAR